MSAMHWPSGVERDMRGRAQLVRSALLPSFWPSLLAFVAATISFDAAAEEPVPAVFKSREVAFMYRSSEVFYPCHELQNRVAVILRAVGARDDIDVRASGCEEYAVRRERSARDARYGSDPFNRSDPFDRSDPFNRSDDRLSNRRNDEQMVHVRVRLMTAVKVTPQVLAEIDKDKSRRELISRVTGNKTAAMNDPVVFAAQRQTVTLSRRTIRLEPEDCDLLDEMTKSVFRELEVRVVRGMPNCNGSRIAPQVDVEAFVPVGMITQGPTQVPGAGEFNKDPAAPTPAPAEAASPATAPASEPTQPAAEPAEPAQQPTQQEITTTP